MVPARNRCTTDTAPTTEGLAHQAYLQTNPESGGNYWREVTVRGAPRHLRRVQCSID